MSCLVLVLALVFGVAPAAPAAADPPAALAPYHDLLEVLTLQAWHLEDDLYRDPVATDAAGRNVFAVTLRRLEAWRQRFPTRLTDVVAFGRAQALERLGAYADAATAYERVAADDASPLGTHARGAAARARRFAAVAALPESGPGLQAVLDRLADKLDGWHEVADAHPEPPYRSLALVESERLEARATTLLLQHRHALADGTATAERALRALIDRHAESKLLPRHVLRLGDFYATCAEEFVEANDRPLVFDAAAFRALTDRALDAYQKLATWDGVPEKPIARSRFDATATLRDLVLEQHR